MVYPSQMVLSPAQRERPEQIRLHPLRHLHPHRHLHPRHLRQCFRYLRSLRWRNQPRRTQLLWRLMR